MGQDCTILYFGGSLAVTGLLVMALSNHLKNRRVREAMLGHEGMSVPPSIGHLWNEVGLGVILTGAVLFFAWLCFRSDLAPRIAWPVAFGASLLCGIGCFIRARDGMNSMGITRDEGADPVPIPVFPEERPLLAVLAFFALGLTAFLAGLLTMGWWAASRLVN